MRDVTVDDITAFVRDHQGIGRRRVITPETRFDADLGITGDDGLDLIRAAQAHFGVSLMSEEHGVREAFGLGSDEFLFGPEGFDPIGWLIGPFMNRPQPIIRDLTAAALFQAILSAPRTR